jgi:hypothetical protein
VIKLKNILLENSDAKILYTKDKNGNYIITKDTLTNFLNKHSIKGINKDIAKRFVDKFDYNAINQFASKNPTDNINRDIKTILGDYKDMYRRW